MRQSSSFLRRSLMIAAVLVATTAALGFAQSMSGTSPGNSSESGVLVISVPSGSPASKAGLVRGDIILKIDGSAVNSALEVREAVTSHKQGDTVSVLVLHGDGQKTLSVALSERNGAAYLGARLLPDERNRTSMAGPGHADWSRELSEGAYVSMVSTNGPAYKAGIRQGDVIVSVDGTYVDSDHSLNSLIQNRKTGETVILAVRSRLEPMYQALQDIKITLGSTPESRKPWIGIEYRNGSPTALSAPWNRFPKVTGLLEDLGILRAPATTA